jgi:tripartite-type tricarboxylate transporter receptor subunit TctC
MTELPSAHAAFVQSRIAKPGRALLLLAMFVGPLALPASAQSSYPERPVKIVLPFGAGGVGDVMTRLVTEKLGQKLGQRFLVENNPGAGGISAARTVLQSPADGYTLAYMANATALSVSLFKQLPFDPVRDFVPVSSLGYFDLVFATARNSPYQTLGDFVRAAKEKPGQLNVGTIVAGSMQHLGVELLKSTAGLNVTVVPFRNSGEVLVALERNDVQMAAEFQAALRGGIEAGKFTAIGTSGLKRTENLPDVPTMKEAGAGDFEVTGWSGFFAPVGTPPEVVRILNAALIEILADPDTKKRALELGIRAGGSTPEEIHARLKEDIVKWAKVIEIAGIEKR